MSDSEVSFVQCGACARHVRSDSACPFCERDAKSGSIARPAAVVIAALAALAPIEASAEMTHRVQRSAQSGMAAAYGAPAPAYGLAPVMRRPPEVNRRFRIAIAALGFNRPSSTAVAIRRSIEQTRDTVASCAESLPSSVRAPFSVAIDLTIGAQAGEVHQVRATVTGLPRDASASLQRCVQGVVQRATWTRDPNGANRVRWSYRATPGSARE